MESQAVYIPAFVFLVISVGLKLMKMLFSVDQIDMKKVSSADHRANLAILNASLLLVFS